MVVLKNVIILCEEGKSEITINSNNIFIGNKVFSYLPDKIYYNDDTKTIEQNKGFWRKFIHTIVRLLYNLADLIHGIESGYKICCITAFLRNERYNLPGVRHILCYKCYRKLLKSRKYKNYKKIIKKK